MREAVIEAGGKYIAVDLKGERSTRQIVKRSTAVVLRT